MDVSKERSSVMRMGGKVDREVRVGAFSSTALRIS
jgi:hypothetical protein